MQRHIRVQVTLLAPTAGGRNAPIPAGEFRTVLGAASRRFSAVLHLNETAVPGGPAVHGEATLLEPDVALSFLPPGTQFEVWEGSRKGYGFVLGRIHS